MATTAVNTLSLNEEERLRADLYGFLARFLLRAPSPEILRETSALNGDATQLGQAFVTLSKLAATTNIPQAIREYEDLFIGVGRGELLPYGSYYLTGFLNEKPLAKLRNSLSDLGIERLEEVKEPEDHIGTLMEVMEGLILGRFGPPATLEIQKKFYIDHIESWASHFFNDLENARFSVLYQPIGAIGKLFLEIENAAFSME